MSVAVADHLVLVKRVAGKIARRLPHHVVFDDLLSAGAEGLLDAARRFDPARGVSFGAYAAIRIRGAVMDELRHHDFLPRAVRRRQHQFEQAHLQARREGTSTSDAALGARLGVAGESLAGWRDDAQVTFVSVEEATDQVPDPRAPADAQLDQHQRVHQVRRVLGTLPKRLQTLLSLYYLEGLTLRDIGALLGVTESRVCQLHGQALKQVRGRLA
jgi:RNA polymerase sigma factor for flagellar operon FliA